MKLTRRSGVPAYGRPAPSPCPIVRRARAEEGKVNVYNWVDYIGETTIEDFTEGHRHRGHYDNYDSAEAMEAKMHGGLDRLRRRRPWPARPCRASSRQRLSEARQGQAAEHGPISIPTILKILEAGIPATSMRCPICGARSASTYNVDMVKERLPNADLKSSISSSSRRMPRSSPIAASPSSKARATSCRWCCNYIGKDPEYDEPGRLSTRWSEAFKPIRQYIKTFDNCELPQRHSQQGTLRHQQLVGRLCDGQDRAKEAGVEINLAYYVPETGSPAWFDVFVHPGGCAATRDNAHKFINYMMEPEVIAKCTNFTNYANANKAAKPFIDKAVLEDPAVYPERRHQKRLWTRRR